MDRASLVCAGTLGQVTTVHEGVFGGLSVAGDSIVFNDVEAITRVSLAGGKPTTLVQASVSAGVWVLGDRAYFVGEHPVGVVDPQGKQPSAPALFSVPLAGGTAEQVPTSSGYPSEVISDGEALYFSSAGGKAIVRLAPPAASVEMPLPQAYFVTSLAVVGEYVYGTIEDFSNGAQSTGGIIQAPKAGGAVVRIVSGIGHAWNIVADEGGLFWNEDPPVGQYGNSHIGHAALDGSGVSTFLDQGANSLALDADYLYLASDTVTAFPRAGGTPITLATGLEGAGLLTVSGGNLIWANLAQRALSETRPMQAMITCVPGATAR